MRHSMRRARASEFVQRYRQSLAAGVETQPALVVFAATAPMAEGASLQGFAQAVPGMGTVFVMLTVLGGMVTLLNERRQWTLQRMVVAPIRRVARFWRVRQAPTFCWA